MKRYQKYKDSSIEWLGEIPEHWTVKKLKFVANVQPSNVDKKTFDDEIPVLLCNYSNVYNNQWITNEIDFMEATATQEEIRKFSISKGDVIITKDSENFYDIAVPALVVEDFENVVCGYHLTQIRPKKLDGNFLFRLFQCKRFNGQFVVNANGVTRFGLPSRSINDAFIGFPPLEEQKTIARFLDRKLEQIDYFISNKQRLIELLKEQKTAIVNRAVTKGLNSYAPMKPSGIEWLGEIPAHWEVERIGKLSESLQTGPFGSQLHSYEYVTGGIPVINPSNMKDSRIFADVNCAVNQPTWERLKRHALKTGDIVFARRGEMGRCALVTEKENGWICGTGSLRMRPKRQNNITEFLIMVLSAKGVAEYLSLMSVGSTMENLNTGILQRLPLPIPPVDEQKQIVEYIHKINLQTNLAIAKAEKEIELIQEYRTTLISDAVTGKIDVREPSAVEPTLTAAAI